MNIRNRRALFLHRDVIRGRYLKDDQPGGGTSASNPTPAPANGGASVGNSSSGATGDSEQNNTSGAFDPASFWQGQEPGGAPSSDSESADGNDSASDANNLRDTLTERLNNLQFGEPVITQETFEAAQSGDFSGLQAGLNKALAQAVQQSLGLSISVLRPFADQMMTEVEARINGRLGERDDNDQLIKDFPAAKDPKIRPVVDNLYKQALKNTKGDRSAAVEQVKEMMRLMSTSVADDLGLNVAPRSADDSGRPPNRAVNWLDELSSRE